MLYWINQFSILECFFYGSMMGFLIVAIIGVIYAIREYLWSRAYNDGFITASRNSHTDNWLANYAFLNYRISRNRRAFILGARHAKGY